MCGLNAMKPMFLPEVENKPGSGPYEDMLQAMKAAGAPVPQIFHLFRYKPSTTQHLQRFTHEVMRGPSPLSAGQRELIAAFTSHRNDCPF
jgi:hypothetical protein